MNKTLFGPENHENYLIEIQMICPVIYGLMKQRQLEPVKAGTPIIESEVEK